MTAVSYVSLGEQFFNQEFIVETLRSSGYDISIRTLRYWRTIGHLPKLYLTGTQLCYNLDVVDKIRKLCESSGRYLGEEICRKELEGEIFNVFAITVTKPDDKYQISYKTNKGLLIERKSNLDGIYG